MMLKTKRLILRPPKKSDWKDVIEGVNDVEVSKNLKVVPYPYKKKDALEWINKKIKEFRKRRKDDYTFMIELKSEKKVIGATGIHRISKKNSKCTTGSWINKNYWRKGYILEAKVSILDFIFNKLKLKKVETGAYAENIASNKMSQKLGFKKEGVKRKSIVDLAENRAHDEVIYGLFKKEWLKTRPRIVKEVERKINELK